MSLRGAAYIAGAFEHPRRDIPDRTVAQIHAEVAYGALADAGLTLADVDAYYCAGDAPGFGPLSMAEYLGLKCRTYDSTEAGGSSYEVHVGHAAAAIAAGHASVALITLAGNPRNMTKPFGGGGGGSVGPEMEFEALWGTTIPGNYALAARRHMYQYGTSSEQLAEIKVAASIHAQHNVHAFLQEVVTIDEVLNSPLVADPLHRLDCCVITDGGGALVVVSPQIAATLERTCVKLLGQGEAAKDGNGGKVDLTYTGAVRSGPAAFAEAGLSPVDVDYVSIYDSFTITVLMTLEDLGFCEKGMGGRFVSDGRLVSGVGTLPFNTDGGGLCNNHPANRGGMTKIIEAVRQLRREAHPAVQVNDCQIALAHGTGGTLSGRMMSSTVILGVADA